MEPLVKAAGQEVSFFALRRLLLVLHHAGSVVLVGSATHHAIRMRHYVFGRFDSVSLERVYGQVVAVAYTLTFLLGAALYPTYRVHVRGPVVDVEHAALVAFFDLKEMLAALTLPLALGLGALALTLRPIEAPEVARVYAVMSFVVCAVVWLSAVAGVLAVSMRGVG